MAFYTAEYIKKLLRDDADNLNAHLKVKNNTFRTYIDATLPFTIYLDINIITKKVVTADSKFIKELIKVGAEAGIEYNEKYLIENIINAYKRTIYTFNTTLPKLNTLTLQTKINTFQKSYIDGVGNTRQVLKEQFGKMMVSEGVGKSDPYSRALVIAPSFYAIQKKFAEVFKEEFKAINFSEEMNPDSYKTQKGIAETFVTKNLALLQNIGHVEGDIISSDSSEVKRGLVTPKLLAALVVLPKETTPSKLARTFSDETAQGTTRVVVRKLYKKSKLDIEIIIESGFLFGTIESQSQNLGKSGAEQKFALGSGLTKKLVEDKKFVLSLVTSKSLLGYVQESVLGLLAGTPQKPYQSTTEIKQTSKIVYKKITVKEPKLPKSTPVPIRVNGRRSVTNLISLEGLLQQRLADQIKKNMGSGNRRDVLNLRTGRLAESAKIERLSESREGMITAFYTYMKYPYATFSRGGRQERPYTRDPKLLISRSIREIGAELAANRMRAVNV